MVRLAGTGIGAGLPHAERLQALYDAARWADPAYRKALEQQHKPAQRQLPKRQLSLRDELEFLAR
jgi:hypothetical protein